LGTEYVEESTISSQQNFEATTEIDNHWKNESELLVTEYVEESTLSSQQNEKVTEETESGEPLFLPLISVEDQTVQENGLIKIENSFEMTNEKHLDNDQVLKVKKDFTSDNAKIKNGIESDTITDLSESKSSEALEFLSKITEIRLFQ
jgi:hypothetical protein